MMRNPACRVFSTACGFFISGTFFLHEGSAQERAPFLREEIAVVPGRPSVADPAAISAAGVLEAEVGLSHARDRRGDAELTTPLVFKYSLSDRLQLRASSDGVATTTSRSPRSRLSFTNLSLGAQYVLVFKEPTGLDAGVRVESTLLNENNDFMTSNFTFLGLFSKDFGDPHLDLNFGYRYQEYELPTRQSQWHIAAALDGSLIGPWRWAGELRRVHSDGFKPIYGLAALSYQPHRAVSWDFGVEFGLNNYAPQYTLFAGVVFVLLK